MSKIIFKPPEQNAPGFPERFQKVNQIINKLNRYDVGTIAEAIDFLVPYVVEPEDEEEARQALMQATRDQFFRLLNSVAWGDGSDPLANEN